MHIAVKFFAKVIGIIIVIAVIISIVYAVLSDGDFLVALTYGLFISGVAAMGVGALVSSGKSEYAIQTTAHMYGTHHSKYYEQIKDERQNRRDEQFWFMILMFIAGLGMMGIAGLIAML